MTRPNCGRRNTLLCGRACVHQVAVLTVELVVQITAISADPAIVKSVDCQRSPSVSTTNFAASSIQKPKCFSVLDKLLPLGESTMITFFAKQFR
jgi:hypothetical protein